MEQRVGFSTGFGPALHTSVFHSLEKELIPVADTLDLSKQRVWASGRYVWLEMGFAQHNVNIFEEELF